MWSAREATDHGVYAFINGELCTGRIIWRVLALKNVLGQEPRLALEVGRLTGSVK
jgi:hypothetical protein